MKSDLGFHQEDHSYCRFGDAKIKPSLGSWHRGWEIQERLWYSKGTVLIHIISCDVLWLQPVFLMIPMHIPCWCCPYIKSITVFIAHRFLLNWGGSRGYCIFSLITLPLPQNLPHFECNFCFDQTFCVDNLSTHWVWTTQHTVGDVYAAHRQGHWARYGQSKLANVLFAEELRFHWRLLDVSRMP